MKQGIEKIKKLIQPVFEKNRIHLVDIDLRGKKNSQVLTVYADTEIGITMQEITDLSREIEDILDIHDPIEGHYNLQVSSPGIDRPLRELWQYRKNKGREIQISVNSEKGLKELTGILDDVSESSIILQLKKEKKTIPFKNINRGMIKINW